MSLKMWATIGTIIVVGFSAYVIFLTVQYDKTGLAGLGLALDQAVLSIPESIANFFSGLINDFGALIKHYLNPLSW